MLAHWTYPDLRAALRDSYAAVTNAIVGVDAVSALRATGAEGWCVSELLVHQLADAQRALVTFATPADGPPDVDAVTYWRPFGAAGALGTGTPGGLAGAWWVKRSAAAFGASFDALVGLWRETAAAVVHASAQMDPMQPLATQGHVLTGADFVATLIVEATLHHLDFVVALPDADPMPGSGLSIVRQTLDGLLGHSSPAEIADVDWARIATGRQPVDDRAIELLGDRVSRLPLLS